MLLLKSLSSCALSAITGLELVLQDSLQPVEHFKRPDFFPSLCS